MSQGNINIDKYSLRKVFAYYWGCEVLLPAKRKVIKIDEHFFKYYAEYNILKQCLIVTEGNYRDIKDSHADELEIECTKYDNTNGQRIGTLRRSFLATQFFLNKGYAMPLNILGGMDIIEAGIGITRNQLHEILKQNR